MDRNPASALTLLSGCSPPGKKIEAFQEESGVKLKQQENHSSFNVARAKLVQYSTCVPRPVEGKSSKPRRRRRRQRERQLTKGFISKTIAVNARYRSLYISLPSFANQERGIPYLYKFHNTPLLPPKNLHRHCLRFFLGHLHVPGEIANNDYAKFGGVKRGVSWDLCKQTMTTFYVV